MREHVAQVRGKTRIRLDSDDVGPGGQQAAGYHPGAGAYLHDRDLAASPHGSTARRAVTTGPSFVGRVASLVMFTMWGEEWPLHRKAVPVAPRGAPGPIFQDRNMALTW